MQCMQYLKINNIDATSFTNLLLRNTCISFCTSPDSPSLDTWASLAFCKNFLDFSGFNISERLTLLKPL